jgi:hypothetical protein
LYFHSIVAWAAVFLSIVVSIIVLMDHNTKGTRQGNIKYALNTRLITPLSMTNIACFVFIVVVFYSETFNIAYQQPCKPGEYMSL